MNDADFLCWIHERLINVHGEDALLQSAEVHHENNV
jgi:hypothetical protein